MAFEAQSRIMLIHSPTIIDDLHQCFSGIFYK